MAEIASIIHLVLSNTKPAMTEKAVPAKGKYILDEATKTEAKKRVNTLLDAFVLYPELDLDFLKKSFVK